MRLTAASIGAAILSTIEPSSSFARPSFGIGANGRSSSSNGVGDGVTSTCSLPSRGGETLSMSTATDSEVVTVSTSPIEGMRPGTSGLRKKTTVWEMTENYVENFIQSLIDTAMESNGGKMLDTVVVAGDGRYYNNDAIQTIARVLAANGVSNIWIPQDGIMSTPAVSAVIRRRTADGSGEDGQGVAQGGIVLTASHNPGGPEEDFGIKYNEGLGQPAGEEFTETLYEKTLEIKSYRTLNSDGIDLSAPVGTEYQLTPTSKVTLIDPFENYLDALKSCFDFDGLKQFTSRPDFRMLFDGMHGAGSKFARRVLVDELGMPESALMRCDPLPDFGGCHPDPNLTYASELVKRMGLRADGSADDSVDASSLPVLGAANDGDGDRNLIAGAGFFVTPSDSMALICDNYDAIPQFASKGGLNGVARSMPSSAALDVVAEARGIPCFVTPTGWKFFGNLMSSKESFDGKDYGPFLCGEESFGTGSDHVREKDGLWAVLAWMSILSKANEGVGEGEPLTSVREIVTRHWAKYGRHFYCRYDYEGVESESANAVMDFIRSSFVGSDSGTFEANEAGIRLVGAEEFSYEDPVDGSRTSKQGLILNFELASGDPARVVFRLSGTGSSGATIRMYLERYEKDSSRHDMSAPVALKELADVALKLVKMEETTARNAPTVIT